MKEKVKYVVICYSVHENCIAGYDAFDTEEDASEFLKKDSRDTYEEMFNNMNEDDRENLNICVTDAFARVDECESECTWTWEIIRIPI